MPLCTAALLPHSPLLVPEIGRTNQAFLAKTLAAYEAIASDLEQNSVETLVIITPHGQRTENEFIINVAPEMLPDFKAFGFIPTSAPIFGDAILADQIKNSLHPETPIFLISQPQLDYGSGVPLYIFKKRLPQIKTLIISPAEGLGLVEQAEFGAKLASVIAQRNKKIAVIASGDLSNRLKKKSPGGYSPKGAKFDNRLIELLSAGPEGRDGLLALDPRLAKDAGECGLKPLALVLGLISGLAWKTEILAYQTDFGIGYLSARFRWPQTVETASLA